MPSYYETRNLPPGTWDVMFLPSPTSKLKRARLEKIVVDQNARTTLGTITIPSGNEIEAPAILPVPERKSEPILATAPRVKKGTAK